MFLELDFNRTFTGCSFYEVHFLYFIENVCNLTLNFKAHIFDVDCLIFVSSILDKTIKNFKLVGIDWSLLSSPPYTHCFSLIGAKI